MAHLTTEKIVTAALSMVLLVLMVQSCSHYDEIMKNAIESTVNGDSHNAGKNCMSCHHDAKNEAHEKWWYIAGTAYDNASAPARSGGSVELWTKPNRTGEKVYELKIDGSGNFFTQKIINFKGGFYPVVIANNGNIKAMTTQTVQGACNSCHGVTEGVITIN